MAVPTPLTTVFTPAPSCLSEIHWGTASPWFQLGPGTQCIPSGPNPSMSSFYSPGLYCPKGYTVACSTEVTEGTATETRATCCPEATALGPLSVSPFACQVNSLFFATSYGCNLAVGGLASNSLTAVATNSSTFLSTFSVGALDGVNAFSVQIRWQQSDLDRTTTQEPTSTSQSGSQTRPTGSGSNSLPASTGTIVSATSGSSGTSATAVAATASGTTSQSNGLSIGAIVAIAVVIPVIVIAAIIVAFFIIRRRRKRRVQPPVNLPQNNQPTAELPAGTNGYMHMKDPQPSELDGVPRYETGSDTKEPIMKG